MPSAVFPRLRSALFHALRAAFRVLPISETTQDRLRQGFLDKFPTIRPTQPRGLPAAGTTGRRPNVHAGGRALGYVEHSIEPLPDPLPATLVAFYLPQFHTIPENDEWWGKGFTEWRNVARALPQFEGHAQPRLPGDLGFYDLRNPQVMRDQAKLAREYGISAFCFYFYWFGGKTLLEAPLQQWLGDSSIDLSFCLCWANESWSRRWDGRAGDILIAQSHSREDDLAFISHIAPYLRDSRYLRVDGKPLLLVYRPGVLPDTSGTAERWRKWCREHDIGEICIAYVQSFERPDPRSIGFDAGVEFPPNLSTPADITSSQSLINNGYAGQVLDWREVADEYCRRSLPSPSRLFPGVNCGWDNEPRRAGSGRTYLHASPDAYRRWLQETLESRLASTPSSDRLVFINAWNEWAEGAVLEPDSSLGYAWLDATRRALHVSPAPRSRPCAVIHAWYPDTFGEILGALRESKVDFRVIATTDESRAAAIESIARKNGLDIELEIARNRGRDVLPFLRTLYRLRREGVDLVLKLHTKHSPHLADGARWRNEMIDCLVGPSRAAQIVESMWRDPEVGLVAPEGYLVAVQDRLGANTDNMAYVARRIGLPSPMSYGRFPAGSMFWARVAALAPMLDAHFHEEDFEEEAAQIDGTLAHAIERVTGACAASQGLRVVTTTQLLQQEPDR